MSLSPPNVLCWGVVKSFGLCLFFLIYFTWRCLRHTQVSNYDAWLIQTEVQFTYQTICDLPSVLPEFNKFNDVNRNFLTVWGKNMQTKIFTIRWTYLTLSLYLSKAFQWNPWSFSNLMSVQLWQKNKMLLITDWHNIYLGILLALERVKKKYPVVQLAALLPLQKPLLVSLVSTS